jgi:two-component system chemotaxis response regulator CheY
MKSVLIVDDEVGIVTILSDRLRSYGYAVRYAFDGPSALNKVAEEEPDCVLLDLEMPDMGGFEVLEELKKAHPKLPVLVVTASASKQNAKKMLEAGAIGYLLKPFDPKTLQSEVARAVQTADVLDERQ